jgi:hypothetical protein
MLKNFDHILTCEDQMCLSWSIRPYGCHTSAKLKTSLWKQAFERVVTKLVSETALCCMWPSETSPSLSRRSGLVQGLGRDVALTALWPLQPAPLSGSGLQPGPQTTKRRWLTTILGGFSSAQSLPGPAYSFDVLAYENYVKVMGLTQVKETPAREAGSKATSKSPRGREK